MKSYNSTDFHHRPITGSNKFAKQKTSTIKSNPLELVKVSNEKYSRKVFVGGLPPDIDHIELNECFCVYGNLNVDWPHKSETKVNTPPKGYAFLIFDQETSVQNLINNCLIEDEKFFLTISSSTIKDKQVQIRPWCLNDSNFQLDNSQPIDPRKTIFIGGVPRPLKSIELAMIMNRLYGGVCYTSIDIDSELKYPKGAARVSFSNHQSYVSAISARFVLLNCGEIDKRAEIKPYVLDKQSCDICSRVDSNFVSYFCVNPSCLKYFCSNCWFLIHSKGSKSFHKPIVKEGTDRPRIIPTPAVI